MNPIDRMEQDLSEGLIGRPIDRRAFLKRFGGGLVVFFAIGDASLLAQQRPRQWYPTDFNAYLIIGADNRVTCLVGKIEMGQGVITSLAMQLADELDVPLDRVDMVMGDTDRCPLDMGTFGSLSTRQFSPFLRQAAAEARGVLIQMAAEKWSQPAERLQVKDGVIFDPVDPNNRISYGQLTMGKVIERHLEPKPPVKKPSEFKIVGQSILRTDARLKVTGEAKFTADIQLPDMLYAKILRPPAHWATLKQLDTSAAEAIAGVQIVQDGDLIAVLHQYPDVAELALRRIKAEYDIPEAKVNDRTIYDYLLQIAGEPRVVEQAGELETGQREAAVTVEATYFDVYLAHAPVEPHAAVAKFDGDKVTLWVSTQGPFTVKNEVAEALGIAPEKVRVITPFVGGGFGGKNRNLQAVEAARLARRVGKPVQVAWSRAEEFFHDAFRPAAVIKINAGLSAEGAPHFWDYRVYFVGRRGAQHFYQFPHHRTLEYSGSGPAHFVVGPWRAPGNNTNTFARESHIDLLAEKAGMDPVEFRLKYLKDEKMVRVLKAAAERFGYTPVKLPSGRGIGVALGIDAGTYVAEIAEIEVNKTTGQIQVKRVVCAQDMGLVVNPEGARLQMEGCIMMGLGYALTEEIHFNGGQILDTNFDTYQLPRFSWLPKIETVLIDDPEAAPQGGGEPAIICVGGAIANAFYDATGVRLFQLPMTPERIKAAIKS